MEKETPIMAETAQAWMYKMAQPFIKGEVLEIDSGNGDTSGLFINNQFPIRISDRHRENYQLLKKRFEGEPLVKKIYRLDLLNPAFQIDYQPLLEKFNTIVSLHLLKNKKYAQIILQNVKALLQNNGHLIFPLPANTAMYEETDDAFQYLRFANWKELKKILGQGYKLRNIHFFSASTTKSDPQYSKKGVTPESLKLYEKPLPQFELAEKDSLTSGLSMLVIVRIIKTTQK